MQKDEVKAGLTALAEEISAAQQALQAGEDEIGLDNVGGRIEELCIAAMRLPPDELQELQPLMTRVRDDLQTLSKALGAAIEAAGAANDEAESGDGETDSGTKSD